MKKISCFFLLLLSATQGCQNVYYLKQIRENKPAALVQRESILPEFSRDVLKNGLQIFVSENHELPIVQVAFASKFAAAFDPPQKAGLTNLLFSMLNEGAGPFNSLQFADEVAQLGTDMKIGVDDDVSTISYPIAKENLRQSVSLLSLMIRKPHFFVQDFNRQKANMQNSISAAEASASYVANRAFKKAIYANAAYPYAHASEGSIKSLARINVRDVRESYEKNLKANNSALIFSGDITLLEAKKLAEDFFADFAAGKVKPPHFPPLTEQKKAHIILVDRKDSEQSILLVGRPLARVGENMNPSYSVLNQILGGAFNSRLNLKLREEKTWTYGVNSRFEALKGLGPLYIKSAIQNPYAADALAETQKEFALLREQAVSQDELDLAKNTLVFSFPSIFENNQGCTQAATKLFAYDLALEHYATWINKIKLVTASDLQKAAIEALDFSKMTVVIVGDNFGKLPKP